MATNHKREAFRSYLDQAGVIEALTKVLVNLYEEPEKPDQAVEFIKTKLGAPTSQEFDAIVREKEGLEARVADLEVQLKEAREEIKRLNNSEGVDGEGLENSQAADETNEET